LPAALELIAEHPHAYGRALAVAPDGQKWASCDGLRVKIMDAAGAVLAEAASPGATLFGLAFSADGSTLFAAPRALDVASAEWRPAPDPGEAVAADLGAAAVYGYSLHDAAVSPDGLLVARAEFRPPRTPGASPFTGPTQRVLALDALTLERRALLWEGTASPVGALAAGPGLVATWLGEIRVWREDGSAVASLAGSTPVTVTALAFSADGTLLASGSADGALALWPLPGAAPIARVDAHSGHVRAVALLPDGARVATCGEDGRVALRALSGDLLAEAGVGGAVEALAVSPAGDRIFVSTARPTPLVRVYRV
jgi:WD40 repeat protein